jgi:hypothetical protein
MRLKSELYKKEQEEIADKIIDILELDEDNQITLHELDNDKDKQKKILDMIPNMRKYFAFNKVKAIAEPKKSKRPWLAIIRQLTKLKYKMERKDHRIYTDNKTIRTIIYTFSEK